ncbi:MAG TPA: protease pro-enzyme activation domain-containing protein, partial [Acidimicrobiales bacterium]
AVPAGSTVLGPTAASSRLTVDVALEPRDPAALGAFVRAVSTPGDARFHHYLAKGQFASMFGPTRTTLVTARAWLASTGLSVGTTSGDGLILSATGTAGQVEAAFRVPLVRARLADGRTVRLGTRDPSVPAGLASSVTGVIGLSDRAMAHPTLVHDAPLSVASGASPVTPHGPVGPQACAAISSFSQIWTANQLASTYGLTGLYANGRVGAGQTVGIFELEPYTPSDIQAYQTCYGTNVPVTDVAVDGGAGGGQAGEAALDIEVVAGLAPGASITVYSGPNGGTGPFDTYQAMIDADTAKVLSTSWGQCEPQVAPVDRAAEHTLFQLAAAQGQTILAASGDSGSIDCYTTHNPDQTLAVDDPADQPGVTGVGGTSLTTAAPGSPTETAWNSDGGASGGGNSSQFVAAPWQQVVSAQSTSTSYTCGPAVNQQCREVPDVSASADPLHGDAIYFSGGWYPFGGTSQASPLWAAVVADTNQGCTAPAGFLNPTLYGSGAASAMNDVATGTNNLFGGAKYPAGPGYDLATGWGSPRAGTLLALLSGSAAGCPTVTGLSALSGPAVGGTPVTITGTGFGTGTPVVRFRGVVAPVTTSTPTSVTVVTPNVIVGGTAGVTVTTSGTAAGTSPVQAASTFTFVSPLVASVVSDHGPLAGGGQVTINGSGFAVGDTVSFGPLAATGVQVTSPTTITATVPVGSPAHATVPVVVTGPMGTSPSTSGCLYYYVQPGYMMVASDGGVFNYGSAGFFGSAGNLGLSVPMVGSAMAPTGTGYWMVDAGGDVFHYGSAGFFGPAGHRALAHPVVGMAATPDGLGYWLVASDGGIFAYGDAQFHGSTGALTLNQPIVGMSVDLTGDGYWLVASDGGIFAFGTAPFYGSTGNLVLNKPIVGMSST